MWLDPKNFAGKTTDKNGHLFQSIDKSQDATQYVKTVEAWERYAFKLYSVDLSSLFQCKNPSKPEVKVPRKPIKDEVDKNPALQDIYQLKLNEYIKEERALKVALKSVWAVIWGQCLYSIRTILEKKKDIEDLKTCGDVVSLLAYIQHACMNYKDKHHPCITLCQQFCAFHDVFYQCNVILIQKYLQIFQEVVENIERYGSKFGYHPAILIYVFDRDGLIYGDDYNDLEENQKTVYKKKAWDQFLATSFLLGGIWSEYSQLVADFQNSYVLGLDQYPKDVEEA